MGFNDKQIAAITRKSPSVCELNNTLLNNPLVKEEIFKKGELKSILNGRNMKILHVEICEIQLNNT